MPHSWELKNTVGRPNSVQIELVEGCSRICSFCGINGIRDKPGNYKFMKRLLAESLAIQLAGWIPEARYEFAMHGEPLMHPDHLEFFKMFRTYLPGAQMQVTTNGVRFRKSPERMLEEVCGLFWAGIDFIVLDTYYPERDELRANAKAIDGKRGVKVVDFYDDLVPQGMNVYYNHRRKKLNRHVVLMDDIGARDGESGSRVVLNHAGSNPTKAIVPEPLKKTCTNPFREVSVTYNGNVNICCMDWKHEFVMGNVSETDISQIWLNAPFQAARAHLQSKDRSFSPCDFCDKGSGVRSGLLPKYDEPTSAQRSLVPKRSRLRVVGG